MSLISWFRVPQIRHVFRLLERSRRQPYSRPTQARLSLEALEERTLASVAPTVVPTPSNLAFNPSPIASGTVPPAASFFPNTTSLDFHAYPSGGGESSLAVASAFPTQDQLNSQFRDFAVNSQGVNNQLYQTMANLLFGVYGFGSGVMPSAPWMPAAYNLGLANHQYDYATQPDLGL
jgi:hypothetical protein